MANYMKDINVTNISDLRSAKLQATRVETLFDVQSFFHKEPSCIFITVGCRSVCKLQVCPSGTTCVVTEKSFASMQSSNTKVEPRFRSFCIEALFPAWVGARCFSSSSAVSWKNLPGPDGTVIYLCGVGGDDLFSF